MDFVVETRTLDDPEVLLLVEAVQAEYVRIYGGRDEDTTTAEMFAPPAGLFLLGRLDGVPVASGGFRRLEPTVAEIKRMYVAEGVRGRGLARLMLGELEARAYEAGARRIVLNTGNRQRAAMALYESSGYQRIPGYGHYADFGGAFFYGKALA